jgi:hypothetical protein
MKLTPYFFSKEEIPCELWKSYFNCNSYTGNKEYLEIKTYERRDLKDYFLDEKAFINFYIEPIPTIFKQLGNVNYFVDCNLGSIKFEDALNDKKIFRVSATFDSENKIEKITLFCDTLRKAKKELDKLLVDRGYVLLSKKEFEKYKVLV